MPNVKLCAEDAKRGCDIIPACLSNFHRPKAKAGAPAAGAPAAKGKAKAKGKGKGGGKGRPKEPKRVENDVACPESNGQHSGGGSLWVPGWGMSPTSTWGRVSPFRSEQMFQYWYSLPEFRFGL